MVKSDDKEIVENYRGISLLCIISKILEKCVFSYVFPFFQPQIYHLQDGFVSGRSCVTSLLDSLLRSTQAFAKALDERKQVDAIFLDYSKAFDSVSFNCLLKELFDVGVRGGKEKGNHYPSSRVNLFVINVVVDKLQHSFPAYQSFIVSTSNHVHNNYFMKLQKL